MATVLLVLLDITWMKKGYVSLSISTAMDIIETMEHACLVILDLY